jgi:hypothetical protein
VIAGARGRESALKQCNRVHRHSADHPIGQPLKQQCRPQSSRLLDACKRHMGCERAGVPRNASRSRAVIGPRRQQPSANRARRRTPAHNTRGRPRSGNAPAPAITISNGRIEDGCCSAARTAAVRDSCVSPMNASVKCRRSGATHDRRACGASRAARRAQCVDNRSRGANQVRIKGHGNEQPHVRSIRLTMSSAACEA